ncbi:MAG: permease [Tenericutes bacterium]|nr:permease [Mycoplasmatota bacterium]
MSITSYILYGGVGILLILAFIKDKQRAILALKKGYKSFVKLLPSLIPIMLLMGIMLVMLDRELIKSLLGEDSGILGILLSSIIGSIAFMPSFLAFPFGKSLLDIGAGYPQVAAFVAGLMSVGIVSISVEKMYFGTKFTVLRNILGYTLVIVFALFILLFVSVGVL